VNLLLGFCWQLLRQFQATPDFGDEETGGKENSFEVRMLEWAKSILVDYPDINITGFDSFNDGKALLALLEKYDKKIMNYRSFEKVDPLHNAMTALQLAEQYIQIPQELLDAQELVEGSVSEKQMVLYLTLFYNAFSDKDNLMSRDSIVNKIKELERELERLMNERDRLLYVTNELEGKKVVLTQSLESTTFERDDLSDWKQKNC